MIDQIKEILADGITEKSILAILALVLDTIFGFIKKEEEYAA